MPWICDKCGEVADGAMCIKCGNQRGHVPVKADRDLTAYTGGGAPIMESGGGERLTRWGPMSWIALVLGILFMAAMYLSNVR
jgi:hypothetical protein